MSTKQQNKTQFRRATPKLGKKPAIPIGKRKPVKILTRQESAQLAEAVMPDEGDIKKVTATLKPADRDAVSHILTLLAEHLGSAEAARLWLVTKSPEFGKTPLDAIAEGKGNLVLAVLESRWGPSPTYA